MVKVLSRGTSSNCMWQDWKTEQEGNFKLRNMVRDERCVPEVSKRDNYLFFPFSLERGRNETDYSKFPPSSSSSPSKLLTDSENKFLFFSLQQRENNARVQFGGTCKTQERSVTYGKEEWGNQENLRRSTERRTTQIPFAKKNSWVRNLSNFFRSPISQWRQKKHKERRKRTQTLPHNSFLYHNWRRNIRARAGAVIRLTVAAIAAGPCVSSTWPPSRSVHPPRSISTNTGWEWPRARVGGSYASAAVVAGPWARSPSRGCPEKSKKMVFMPWSRSRVSQGDEVSPRNWS